ncbi:MAG: spermidine/putrescine ABC transporter ATP-binding protein, partial [Clostridia bacterium]|nr:spermidine/putrescine ABC transporter ATP-binding protein [Clostridia bacterium]
TRLEVSNDLFKIIKGEKKSAILVTHDISEAISMADKIIVLSNRPAKIKGTFTVDFPKELTPLKRRESPNFHLYFEKIWKEFERDES